MDQPFRLEVEKCPTPLVVVAFEGRERQNHPSRFEIDVLASEEALALLLQEGAGLAAQLFVDEGAELARRPAGLITALRVIQRLATGAVRVRVRLESRWTRMTRRKRSRIFLEVSAAQMFEETFKHHGVPSRMATTSDLRARSYTVQYREPDAALVQRLLGEEGLAAYVEDPPPGSNQETWVIGDDPSMYTAMPGRVPLEVRDSPTPEEHQLTHVTLDFEATVRRVGLRGHDLRRPGDPRPSGASTKEPWHTGLGGEVDEYEVDAQRGGPLAPERGDWTLASARVSELQKKTRVLRATTTCKRVAPGRRVAIVGHDVAEVDGEYVIVEVRHRGQSNTDEASYSAEIVAVPANVVYRARPPKRRLVQVAEPALVVGAPGVAAGDPYVDALGRVKVRFPWHVEALGSDRDSTWLRVVQPWAGSGWGTQFIPRVGMEVLVTFLGGDVDCPVVIGALPSGLAPPPFPLPESAATSGIRSRSTPGGEGYNELAFHDGKGAELVSLRAERDFRRVVQGDETSSVGGSRHDEVAGELVVTVSGGERRDVGGPSRSELRGDVSVEVHGSHTLDVSEQLTMAAGGKLGLSARGFTSVELARGLSLEVGGDAVVRAVGPQSTLRVDAKSAAIVAADKLVQLTSPEEVVLSVGDAKIRLTHDTIELDAPNLILRGRESLSAKGKGPSLELGEKAELVAKEVKILSEKAELTLSRDAELKGENIKLAKPADPPEKGAKDPEKKTKPFKIKVADAMHEPYADRHYVLLAGSEKLEGETGADGDVDVSIPESATTVDLTVWVGEYPTSEKRRFQIVVEELGAPDTPAGAQRRLRNLGFYAGEPEPELTQAGRDALRAFQFAHELEPSGDLDATTVGKLKEVHGE